ncbi:MAG: DUF1249 domain-containing protein [Gammaproteobacteria bacterium]|nr:DUF1249 domain-containing protein [Gammaproteobacteria bacterium]
MALYESNYVRFRWLFPDLQSLRHSGTRMVSASAKDFPLYLEVLEAARYTTTLRLTYFLDSEGGVVADPDLRLRIYHDAGQVEAMSFAATHQHQVLQRMAGSCGEQLERRWRRNMMLNKWLEYCADCNHDFSAAADKTWITGSKTTGFGEGSSTKIGSRHVTIGLKP